jgi:hypothetical protein
MPTSAWRGACFRKSRRVSHKWRWRPGGLSQAFATGLLLGGEQRGHAPRSRRVTDDLAWLRVALCDPEPHGLHPLSHGRAVAAWVPDDDAVERLRRLSDRAILEAAGFRLFENETAHT